jgi:hypothetical protein
MEEVNKVVSKKRIDRHINDIFISIYSENKNLEAAAIIIANPTDCKIMVYGKPVPPRENIEEKYCISGL